MTAIRKLLASALAATAVALFITGCIPVYRNP